MSGTDRRTGYNGRRVMYFHTWSKRDTDMPEEEQVKRWKTAFTQYCKECSDRYDLKEGRCVTMVGTCDICGRDTFIVGRLPNDNSKIIEIISSIVSNG